MYIKTLDQVNMISKITALVQQKSINTREEQPKTPLQKDRTEASQYSMLNCDGVGTTNKKRFVMH